MVKDTQTSLLPTNCGSVFDYFVGLALKGLNFLKFFVANIEVLVLRCH